MEKKEDYAVFLAMYILMLRDGAILKGWQEVHNMIY
jgi:hypothetical protein